ncbi:MAG: helix-turn-helix transcriptional regulator [Firmicutes bacterium]|nr:helix-turn-helix transcriptional regulator [Bacillota bacterium]
MKKFFRSYYNRVLIVFIVMGSMPVIIVGSFSYYYTSRVLKNNSERANKQILSHFQLNVEQDLLTIEQLMSNYIQSPLTDKLMNSHLAPQDFALIRDGRESLAHLFSYRLTIEDVNLVNFDKGWMLGSEQLTKNPQVIMQKRRLFDPDYNNTIFYQDSDKYVTVIKTVPIHNYINPSGLLIVHLSAKNIDALIKDTKGLGMLAVVNKNNKIINGSDEFFPKEVLTKMDRINELWGRFEIRLNGRKVFYNVQKSEYTGWRYVSIMTAGEFYREALAIAKVTMLVCFGVLLAVLLFSYLGSKKIYTPIKKLYKLVESQWEENHSFEYTEFSEIFEQINTLVQKNNNIAGRLENHFAQQQKDFIYDVITKKLEGDELKKKAKDLGYGSLPKLMFVFVTQVDSRDENIFKEKDIKLLYFALNNIICELLGEYMIFQPAFLNLRHIAVIGTNEGSLQEVQKVVDEKANEIKNKLFTCLNTDISIGVSKWFNSYLEINPSFRQALYALKNRIRAGHSGIFYAEQIKSDHFDKFHYPMAVEQNLIHNIKTGDRTGAENQLDQFFDTLFAADLPFEEYDIHIVRLISNLFTITQESGVSYSQIAKEEKTLLDHVGQLNTSQELKKWTIQYVIDPLIELFNGSGQDDRSRVKDEILSFIKENYSSNPTLEECAKRLHYHPMYVRRLFQQEMGISFSQYVLQYKMSLAKKWLIDTADKVFEIAERLGYNNSQNFIRTFKKVEGITPAQFRRRAGKRYNQ